MPVPPTSPDLLTVFYRRRQALWESLSLLAPAEWMAPVLDGSTPHAMLAARLAADRGLAAVVSVTPDGAGPAANYRALMEQAVATAQRLAERLQELAEDEWLAAPAAKPAGNEMRLAEWVAAVNADYAASLSRLDAYLGSFERLGTEGLKNWLLMVYNEIMDSVAGMTDAEIMGEPWRGDWNTYQVLEHVWAWNEQVLEIGRHWGQTAVPSSLRPLPAVGEYNRHLGKVYDGRDMVAVADALVTVYRKTAQLIDRAGPDLLRQVDDYPWPGRGPLCNLIFETYRHAYGHAQEVGERVRTVNNQQSTVNSQQSTINSQQSTVNNQQSTVNSQQSTKNLRLDT